MGMNPGRNRLGCGLIRANELAESGSESGLGIILDAYRLWKMGKISREEAERRIEKGEISEELWEEWVEESHEDTLAFDRALLRRSRIIRKKFLNDFGRRAAKLPSSSVQAQWRSGGWIRPNYQGMVVPSAKYPGVLWSQTLQNRDQLRSSPLSFEELSLRYIALKRGERPVSTIPDAAIRPMHPDFFFSIQSKAFSETDSRRPSTHDIRTILPIDYLLCCPRAEEAKMVGHLS